MKNFVIYCFGKVSTENQICKLWKRQQPIFWTSRDFHFKKWFFFLQFENMCAKSMISFLKWSERFFFNRITSTSTFYWQLVTKRSANLANSKMLANFFSRQSTAYFSSVSDHDTEENILRHRHDTRGRHKNVYSVVRYY